MKGLMVLLPVAVFLSCLAQAEEASPQDLLVVPPVTARGAEDAPESVAKIEDKSNEDEATPQEGEGFPLSRYAALWKRSPFQLESIAPTSQSEGIGQRFALTGIAQIDGEPIVFVMERATQERSMVKKDGSRAGLTLVQIDVQQKYSDSTAMVRLDGEVGTIKFDATAAAPAMPQAMIVPQSVPGGVQHAAPMVPPVQPIPGAQNQSPQANGQVQPNPNNGQQVQAPPPRVIRRRLTIPAAP